MAAEVLVPSGGAEAGTGENRLHIGLLARPDLHQHMAVRRQVRRGMGSDGVVGIKSVVSSDKRDPGVKVPDIGAQA